MTFLGWIQSLIWKKGGSSFSLYDPLPFIRSFISHIAKPMGKTLKILIVIGGIYPLNNLEEIVSHWQHVNWDKKLSKAFGKSVHLIQDRIEVLKNSREKTSIWRLAMTDGIEHFPIVLKIFKMPLKEKHSLEISMYTKAYSLYHEYIPKLYGLEPNEDSQEIWMVTEYVKPLRGQIKLAPHHLERIIPTVAKFHAQTFGNRFLQHANLFDTSLPKFDSPERSKGENEIYRENKKVSRSSNERSKFK